MRSNLFWMTATLLLAAAIHLSYILFIPLLEMDVYLNSLRERAGTNTLHVLSGKDRERFLAQDDPHLISAVCVADLSAGPIHVSVMIPPAYWSMNIYSARGISIYTLNDRQAGVRQFSLMVRQSEGSWQDRLSPQSSVATDETGTATIETEQDSVLVVLRSLPAHSGVKGQILDAFSKSACSRTPQRQADVTNSS